MKRLLLTLLALLLLCLVVQPSFGAVKAPAKKLANARAGIFGNLEGGEVPFPFGSEVPFPWSTIEGTYFAQSDEYEAYFSFDVSYEDNEPVLKIRHYENSSGKLFGEGGGMAQADHRIVRAAMRARSGFNYLVFIRSFGHVRLDNGNHVNNAMVLTIRSFGPRMHSSRDWHFLLRKLSNRTVYRRYTVPAKPR